MNIGQLDYTEAEAHRFLAAVGELRKRLRREELQCEHDISQGVRPNIIHATKESGSVTRASLDLTRALADLRKP